MQGTAGLTEEGCRHLWRLASVVSTAPKAVRTSGFDSFKSNTILSISSGLRGKP
jgi:hypothetical protein